MRVLFDIDVILDLLLDRQPHAENAARLLSEAERGGFSGYLCATAVTTIYYLAAKSVGARRAREHVRSLLSVLEVAPVNRGVLEGALLADFRDFEDAVTHESARLVEAHFIVTRNLGDFRGSQIAVHSPRELLALLAASQSDEG